MGPCSGGVPGHGGSDSPYVDETCNIDHSGESTLKPGVTCEMIEDIDEKCVNEAILVCENLGKWSLWNQCQSYAAEVIERCNRHQYTCEP
jgi:hypothetical protein